MSELRRSKYVLVRRAANLAPIAVEPDIDGDEIRDFYDQLRAGLGTSIVRELTEVISFKSKIEQFQRHLLDEKSRVVDVEIRSLNRQLAELDRRYAKLVAVLDQDVPLGRPGQPVELAPIYVFLASQEASFVTGEVYGATGGNGTA